MTQQRTILASLILLVLAFSGTVSLNAQDLDFKASDFGTNASGKKAELEARLFLASPKNKPQEFLTSKYFDDAAKTEYKISDGDSFTLRSGNKIIAAVLIAKAMRELEASLPDAKSDELLRKWIDKQDEVLAELGKGEEPILEPTSLVPVWNQFLLQWIKDAEKKEDGKFREALLEASFEIVRMTVNIKASQVPKAKSGPAGTGTRSSGTSSGSGGTGAYYPMHERLMNHIYRHNDRRMNKAERIRARY